MADTPPIGPKLKELTESVGKSNCAIVGIQGDDGKIHTFFSMSHMQPNVVVKAIIRVLDMFVTKTIK